MTPKLFTELGLSPETLKAVERLGFEQASPIQAEAIPVLLSGRDVVGQSQTGSGKTAAFGIPAIERIDPKIRGPQALILCPTRELAVQVSEEIHKLAAFKKTVRPLPIFGGASYERQYAGIAQGANIIIGTPGRVKDHLERGSLKLDQVRTVILDEADEMLDMGFRDELEAILQHAPPERQTVLFSATIPPAIQDLISRYTRDPVRVAIAARSLTVPTVEQVYYEVHRDWKFEALTRLIDLHEVKLGIVFCNTQRTVDELTEHLHTAGYDADALHGGLAQAARDRVMKKFKSGVLTLLVATDVAGRGIDVNDVEVVFNFDLPYDPEDYVHRIGRTGRAGRSGLAVTLVSGRDFFRIRHLENFTRQRIRRGKIPSENELAEAKDRQLLDDVRTVIQHADLGSREQRIKVLMDEGFDTVQVACALLHLLTGGEVPPVTEEVEPRGSLWGDAPAVPTTPVPAKSPAPTPAPAAAAPPVPSAKAKTEKPAKKEKRPKRDAVPSMAEAAHPVASQPVAAEAVVPVLAAGDETAAEPAPPAEVPAHQPAAPAPARPVTAVDEDAGFESGESRPVTLPAEAPKAIEAAAAVHEPVTASTVPEETSTSAAESGAAPTGETAAPPPSPRDEPPQFRSSAWNRPRLSANPGSVPAEPRAPLQPRGQPGFERPSRPQSRERGPEPRYSEPRYGARPPFERETRGRFDDARGGDDRRQRFTARPDGWMQNLWLGVGEVDGVTTRDIVGCIVGETGLPASAVGRVQMFDRHALVEVPREEARHVLTRLNQATLRGRPVRARIAQY